MRKRIGATAVVGLAFAAGVAVSFFTSPLWVTLIINAAKEGSRVDWLGFAGGLLGNMLTALVASVAVYFAWRGIIHQLRINVISREEDRVERELPGLRTSHNLSIVLLRQIEMPSGIADIGRVLERPVRLSRGGAISAIISYEWIDPDLAAAEPGTRDQYLRYLSAVRLAYRDLQKVERESKGGIIPDNAFRPAWERFFDIVSEFKLFSTALGERIARREAQLLSFRREIERYFDVN